MMIRTQIRQSFLDLLKSRPHAVALLALLSVATTVPAKSQSEEFAWPNEAFNWHLSYLQSNRHPSLYVEVDAVEGAEPTENMLKMLDAFLRKHCDKPGGITIERSSVIPRKAARGYSADSLAAGYLEGPPVQTNRAPPAFLYILFYDSRVNANVLQSPRDAGQRPLRDPLPAEMARRQDPHVNFIPEYPAMIYFDASFGPEGIDDLPQGIPIECSMKLSQKKRSFGIFAVFPFGKIAPHESASGLSHIYNSSLASFCLAGFARADADFPRLHVYISYTKRA